jgi:hypothetical protein
MGPTWQWCGASVWQKGPTRQRQRVWPNAHVEQAWQEGNGPWGIDSVQEADRFDLFFLFQSSSSKFNSNSQFLFQISQVSELILI